MLLGVGALICCALVNSLSPYFTAASNLEAHLSQGEGGDEEMIQPSSVLLLK